MTTFSHDALYCAGRLIGCYTYMAMCSDGDAIHVKIGLSQEPHKRALTLFHNSPLVIEVMALVDLPSRPVAQKLERELHRAFKAHRTNGEWFIFTAADKPEFNRIQREVLAKFSSPSRVLRWTKINVRQLAINAMQRMKHAQHRWRTGGQAYRDVIASQRQTR